MLKGGRGIPAGHEGAWAPEGPRHPLSSGARLWGRKAVRKTDAEMKNAAAGRQLQPAGGDRFDLRGFTQVPGFRA